MRMTSPTPTLSLLARDVLSLASEKIAFHPSLTLWGACCYAADDLAEDGQRGLDELSDQMGCSWEQGPLFQQLSLSGAEACEAVSALLQAATFPDLSSTIPAPAPTVEALPEAQLPTAAVLVAHAWELIDQARQHLGAHHEADVARLQIDLEQLGARLMAEVEARSAFSYREAAE